MVDFKKALKEKKKETTTTALTKWEQRLADDAKIAATQVASIGGGNKDIIGTKGGHFWIDGAMVPDDSLPVLVIDSVYVNALYEGEYDADNPSSPVCYAFGRDPDTMAPHENSEKPQADSCAECPHNEWGSAGPGKKGKTVRNLIRLGLIAQTDIEEGEVKTARRLWLHVAPTSLTTWAGYVNQISKVTKLPPHGVFTEIKIASHPKKMFELTFSLIDKVAPEAMEEIYARKEIVMTEIDFPYPANGDREEKPAAKASSRRSAPPAKVAVSTFGKKKSKAKF